jgi:hypothetical protein
VKVTREADMRSLERRSLYGTFAPLDASERLPRELLFERREGWTWGIHLGRRQVVGFLWAPALFVALALAAWILRL